MLLYSVAIPLLMTGGSLLLARPWRLRNDTHSTGESRQADRYATPWMSAVGFAASYVVCHLGIHGPPASAQLEAWEWLLLLVPLAAIVGLLDCLLRPARWWRICGFVGLAMASGWCLVPGFQSSPWTWRCCLAALIFMLAFSQHQQVQRRGGGVLPLVWILVGALGLPVLIASANAKFGFFVTSMAAASGAVILVWIRLRHADIARGAVPVVSVVYPALFFSGYFNDYGDVPLAAFVLLSIAPLAFWGAPATSRLPAWVPVAISLAGTVVMCAGALYLAWPALTAEPAY